VLKYSNRTHRCTWNALIEQSFLIPGQDNKNTLQTLYWSIVEKKTVLEIYILMTNTFYLNNEIIAFYKHSLVWATCLFSITIVGCELSLKNIIYLILIYNKFTEIYYYQ